MSQWNGVQIVGGIAAAPAGCVTVESEMVRGEGPGSCSSSESEWGSSCLDRFQVHPHLVCLGSVAHSVTMIIVMVVMVMMPDRWWWCGAW